MADWVFVSTGDVAFVDTEVEWGPDITKLIDLDAILQLLGTKSIGLDADIYDMVGWVWGQQNTSYVEIPEIWDKWKIAGGNPAVFDSSWGKLQLGDGDMYYSDVRDFGDADAKTLEITIDKYGAGTGTQGDIYWRGQAASFDWDAGSPAWEEYTSSASKEWRYVQVRVSV
jgi:hypothetical protein